MSQNERLSALKILVQVLEQHYSLAQVLPALASPMTKELCFGVCRHYLRLSALADLLIDKRPKSIEVWVAIIMGLYQLHYMKLPDYAVVKETVALLDKVKKTWAKGLVNAVLRNFCRKQEVLINSLNNDDQFIYGHPKHLLDRIKKAWPKDWETIVFANDAHPPMTLRVNLKKIAVQAYLEELNKHDIIAKAHSFVPSAITLASPCDVCTLPGFDEGVISVQDSAAQLAAYLLELKSGLRVLDACCAPGGKTCHILETQTDLARCVAVDVDKKRLERVKENLNRQKLEAEIVLGDALDPDQWWNKQLFDRILLDAPCSATGVIRRHADIKLLRTAKEIEAAVQIQHRMLRKLWPLLAPNGIMLYATCSIMPEENEQQIASFVEEHSNCRIIPIAGAWGRLTPHGRQILPGDQGMDGFFYSLLLKEKQ